MPNLGVCAHAGRSWLLLRRPQKTTLHRPRVNNQSDPSPFPLEVCPTCCPPPDCNVKVYHSTLCLLMPAKPVSLLSLWSARVNRAANGKHREFAGRANCPANSKAELYTHLARNYS